MVADMVADMVVDNEVSMVAKMDVVSDIDIWISTGCFFLLVPPKKF